MSRLSHPLGLDRSSAAAEIDTLIGQLRCAFAPVTIFFGERETGSSRETQSRRRRRNAD
jgi:hypothetical protein